MTINKKRLDLIIQEKYPDKSRQQIQSWIMQGNVFVDGERVTKSGTIISSDSDIVVRVQEEKYVGRAGYKLEKALAHFNIDVADLIVLDAGISTGGFTDCLLQQGAKQVFGVDVGYGQLHEKIRADKRVTVFERTNLRYLPDIGTTVDLVTLDLSFISVLKVMDTITKVLKSEGKLIVLIKPQFEAERHQVGKGGIIRDPHLHQEIVEKVVAGIQKYGFALMGLIESPILGTMGNKEFLAYFARTPILV